MAAEQWVSSCIYLTIMRKIVVFGKRRVLCEMPRQNHPEELFVLPHTCSVLHHVKRHIYYSYTSQKAIPRMITCIIIKSKYKLQTVRLKTTCSVLQTAQDQQSSLLVHSSSIPTRLRPDPSLQLNFLS